MSNQPHKHIPPQSSFENHTDTLPNRDIVKASAALSATDNETYPKQKISQMLSTERRINRINPPVTITIPGKEDIWAKKTASAPTASANTAKRVLVTIVLLFTALLIVLAGIYSSESSNASSSSTVSSISPYRTDLSYQCPTLDLPELPSINWSDLPAITNPSPTQNTVRIPSPENEATSLQITAWPRVTRRNEDVFVRIKGKPNTNYSITVNYSSGPSTADGLEPKYSNSDGYATWYWHIGGKTNPGTFTITIRGGDESKTVFFSVTS